MENLPSPPTRKTVNQQDAVYTPQANDYGTPASNGKHTTPNGKGAAHRATSPRPHTASPSEHLLRTTAARVNDNEELVRRKSTLVVPEPKPKSVKRAIQPPSESLLKTTQARLSDKREWESKQGVIKHEDDPWWEIRKPAEMAKNTHFKVESKLLDDTAAHVYSARKKFPGRSTPDKLNVPGSTEKVISPAAGCSPTPLNIHKIDPNSALLRTTFNSQVKSVKNAPAPPSPATPTLYTAGSKLDPKKVPSKLLDSTTALKSAKWKSQEDLLKEQAAADAEAAKEKKRVAKPSPNLVAYNKSVASGARSKAVKTEGDPRELGWNQSFKKDSIPAIDQIQPLPAQKRASFSGGSSPGRLRREGSMSPTSAEQRLAAQQSAYSLASTLDSETEAVEPYDPNAPPGIPPASYGSEQLADLDGRADVLDLNAENNNQGEEMDVDAERNAYRYDTGDSNGQQKSEEFESY